jgi:hypothetical protein
MALPAVSVLLHPLTSLRVNPQVSYMTYVLSGHAPFLIGSAAMIGIAVLKWYRSSVVS